MKYIIGENRNQSYLFPISLEKSIDIDNEVRFIDVFVESLKLPSPRLPPILPIKPIMYPILNIIKRKII